MAVGATGRSYAVDAGEGAGREIAALINDPKLDLKKMQAFLQKYFNRAVSARHTYDVFHAELESIRASLAMQCTQEMIFAMNECCRRYDAICREQLFQAEVDGGAGRSTVTGEEKQGFVEFIIVCAFSTHPPYPYVSELLKQKQLEWAKSSCNIDLNGHVKTGLERYFKDYCAYQLAHELRLIRLETTVRTPQRRGAVVEVESPLAVLSGGQAGSPPDRSPASPQRFAAVSGCCSAILTWILCRRDVQARARASAARRGSVSTNPLVTAGMSRQSSPDTRLLLVDGGVMVSSTDSDPHARRRRSSGHLREATASAPATRSASKWWCFSKKSGASAPAGSPGERASLLPVVVPNPVASAPSSAPSSALTTPVRAVTQGRQGRGGEGRTLGAEGCASGCVAALARLFD
jgi:hypothetical protein